MNRLIKKRSLILRLSLVVFCSCILPGALSACGANEDYVAGRFAASIAPEYREVFLERQFTAEDLNIDNEYIARIDYTPWCAESDIGFIYIQLKEPYWNRLDEIMKSVNELDFVLNVERIPIIQTSEI